MYQPGEQEGVTAALLRQREALVALAQLDKADLAASLPLILEASARALEVERVSYWRLEPDRSRISCVGLYRLTTSTLEAGGELWAKDYPAYFRALLEERAIVAHDAAGDPRTAEFGQTYFAEHRITSMLDIPVWHRGKAAGVLCHEHVGPLRDWLPQEHDFALSAAAMLGTALEGSARQQAERRYALLGLATQDILYDWEVSGDRIHWSYSDGSLGYPEGALKPSLAWWEQHIHPDDRDRVNQRLTHHVEQGLGPWRAEYRFLRADGAYATILDRGYLERAQDGSPMRLVGTMMDVTEQRQLEARLTLADRLASVGTLAAGVAHEINNPLSYVQVNLRFAREYLEQAPLRHARLVDALGDAAEGVERVRRIVSDLKTLARPDGDGQARLDLRQVLESALNVASSAIRHRARLERTLEEVPAVLGNEARLGQVALNLLVNAAQAIPEGEVNRHLICVRTGRDPSGNAVLEVRDTGSGVSPKVLRRVFDPFFTTRPVGEGTGIGLAISHSIVTGMGGTITLENAPQGGCIARVVLPPAKQPLPATLPCASQPLPPPPRLRVLVIDDDPQMAAAIRRMLTRDHQVEVSLEPREALSRLRAGAKFDAVLCDLMMPELSGSDFVSELRACAPHLASRVILMTGGAFTPKTHGFLGTTDLPLLEKPFELEELRAALQRVLSTA